MGDTCFGNCLRKRKGDDFAETRGHKTMPGIDFHSQYLLENPPFVRPIFVNCLIKSPNYTNGRLTHFLKLIIVILCTPKDFEALIALLLESIWVSTNFNLIMRAS